MNRVTIEKLIFGGLGLARTDAGIIFVSDVLPGETVEYRIEGKQDGIPLAVPTDYIESSKKRRKPACPYFGECGGCDWLFIDHDFQLQIKKEIWIDCLKRIGKIKEMPEIGIIKSPEKEYRMRAQLKIDPEGKCGFYRKKSNDVVRIDKCLLLTQQINSIISDVRAIGKLTEKSIKIIAGESIASDPLLPGLTKQQCAVHVGDASFLVNGGSFFQSNCFITEKMGTWASPMVSGKLCVDLYGGTGFFSVMLGKQFSKGIMIESIQSQVEIAKYNFEKNGVSHFKALCSNAEQFESSIPFAPDLLIVDPPRPGLDKRVRKSIISVKPSKLLYVSCNPSTQARDVGVFVNDAGYSITHAALFDCYPNTHHIETALLLEKK